MRCTNNQLPPPATGLQKLQQVSGKPEVTICNPLPPPATGITSAVTGFSETIETILYLSLSSLFHVCKDLFLVGHEGGVERPRQNVCEFLPAWQSA